MTDRADTETSLTTLPAHRLAAMLANGEVSSREVTRAHLDRIRRFDGSLRAFTRVFETEAIAEADARDAERKSGRTRGPLHGVPVTVKECFDIAGEATTLGIPAWQSRRATVDAAMVRLLREAGAVILGRTNLSQTMLFSESRNPVFGETRNPFSAKHTPGGSSGGEGAAIASGMSPLGVGTDIGGSVRIPSAFCAIAGIKPTLDRLPMRGYASVLPGQEAVRGQCGPMARTVADLAMFFRALDPVRMSALDARVAPIAFRAHDPGAKFRVGYFTDNGVLAPSQGVARAVARSVEVLRARAWDAVPFTPPGMADAFTWQLAAMSADGGDTLRAALAGGPVDPVLKPLLALARVPAPMRRGLGRVLAMRGDAVAGRLLDSLGRKSVTELWELTAKLRKWRFEVIDAMDAARVDAFVCPTFATPPTLHGGMKNFTPALSYAMSWNAAQLPAGVVPVARVHEDETRSARAGGRFERMAGDVDAASVGLPLAVQVVARPWAESTVLAVMEAIEEGVRGDADWPATPIDPR